MNDLRTLLDEYLATRRALGVRMEAAGRYLKRFVAFAVECEALFITTELALRWATEPNDALPAQWAKRLGLVRGFARFANAVDPRHQIPPQGLIAHRFRRPRPYIYSDREIADLSAAARKLSGTTGLRPFTYAALLALLAVTGMRTSEILNLDRDDVDLVGGVLTVRDSKFGKSRHIPLHESTSLALRRFAARRDRLCPAPRDPAFFLNESGTRITESTLRWTFVRLSRRTGLREPAKSSGYGPRLLDLRHSFAVGTLVRWYRDGVDVERHIPRLATWLGHAHVSDTYCNPVHRITVVMPTSQKCRARRDRALNQRDSRPSSLGINTWPHLPFSRSIRVSLTPGKIPGRIDGGAVALRISSFSTGFAWR